MRRAALHMLLVLLAVLSVATACGRKPRVIPEKKLVRIYTDMFLLDQWIRDHAEARPAADTTLFFDPVFRRYGYTFEDYNRSVEYYVDHPDKYSEILTTASERLRAEAQRQEAVLAAISKREAELDEYRKAFRPSDYSTDSLRWSRPGTLWPPKEMAPDTLVIKENEIIDML